jgi:hypothetical protein
MDKSPLFTPLESPSINDRGVERKRSFLIEGKIKVPSFLTGFIASTDTETEDIDDAHRSIVRSNESQHVGVEKSTLRPELRPKGQG